MSVAEQPQKTLYNPISQTQTNFNPIVPPQPNPINQTQSNFNQIIPTQKTTNPIAKTQTNFNPLTHIPPRYDLFGYLKPQHKRKDQASILAEKDKIKIPWNETATNQSKASTQTELIAHRRKEKIPDISYDLDKDGYVGGRDYVIAKRFDLDNDGKLNEQEKKNAYEGIANNIEDNYIWNIDNQGGTRPFRLLQKRGKLIDAENFLPIQDTYPTHPIHNHKPKYETYEKLKEARKRETINEINEKIQEWEKNNPRVVYEDNFSALTQNIPKHASYEEIKREKHELARINCGLDRKETDIKDVNHDPTLAYIYNPKHKTRGDLDEEFKQENLEQSKKLMAMNHKDEIARLNEREDEVFAKLYSEEDRKTLRKLKEQRRKETNDYNIKTFSKQTIGVHGHDLPQFSKSKTTQEFWKNNEGYCENPKISSHVEYKEKIKYWKPSEELLLNEHRDEPPQSVDPFKKEYHPIQEKKENLIIKVNNINQFKDFDPLNPRQLGPEESKQKHIYRWTTLVNQFAPNKFKKGRFFDVLPKDSSNNADDNKELFSSFKGGVFSSDYMNKNAIKAQQEAKRVQQEKEREIMEFYKTAKDPLFVKFANKDLPKNPLPKGAVARTKAF